MPNSPDDETFLSLRWTEADLRMAWSGSEDCPDDDEDGSTMPQEIIDGMFAASRYIEERINEVGNEIIDNYLSMQLWRPSRL